MAIEAADAIIRVRDISVQFGATKVLDRLNLGLGSAVSVLLFALVALIAFVFMKGFGAGATPGGAEA